MPTGFTHDVQTGKITSLKDFAMLCARGMGALITMRDEPFDAPIPDQLEPSSYNRDRLAEAQTALATAMAMTAEECAPLAAADYRIKMQEWSDRKAERDLERQRYQSMLDKVRAWEGAPEGIKSFMIEQLESSIDFDCRPVKDDDPYIGKPTELSGADWRQARIESAQRDIAYHTKAWREEQDRTASRNAWLEQLRASLADTPEASQ